MANDRYGYDRDRHRGRHIGERDWRERSRGSSGYGSDERWSGDDGYIARRGFGNESSGFGRGSGRRHERGWLERDDRPEAYGAGDYGPDWREERWRGSGYGSDYSRGRDWSGENYGSSYGRGDDRYGTGYFGRGSRDYNEERGFFERAGDEIRSWFGDEEADRRRDRDMREARHYRGRGPKGYQRSDERIREDINDRLTDDPHIDASEIEVTVSNREATLNGTVNSRFEKRHAEDLAESISGVSHVQNNLRIQQYADAGMGGSMLSGPRQSSVEVETGASAGKGELPEAGSSSKRRWSSSSSS